MSGTTRISKSSTHAAAPTAAGIPIAEPEKVTDSKASTGVEDPTDPKQAGDAAIVVEDRPVIGDRSDPVNNGNVGYSAEGQVVSNQQGEQANTSQSEEGERGEIADIRAADAETRDPFSDPAVPTPHS